MRVSGRGEGGGRVMVREEEKGKERGRRGW